MTKEQDNNSQKSWAESIEADTEPSQEAAEAQEKAGSEAPAEPAEASEGQIDHPSYEALEQQLTDAEQRAHKHWNEAVRAQAELKNVRQRAEKDIANARKYALERFVRELLDIADSLENGLQQVPEDQAKAREGLELTLDKFLKVMGDFGVEQLDPEGQPFNPEYHEAMSTQPTDEMEPNHVVQVLQKGYTLNQRLIRPALVLVSKRPAS